MQGQRGRLPDEGAELRFPLPSAVVTVRTVPWSLAKTTPWSVSVAADAPWNPLAKMPRSTNVLKQKTTGSAAE